MSKKFEGSVAPRERINISYVPKTDGQTAEVELPLNMLVVGDKEAENGTISVRTRAGGDEGAMTLDDFMAKIQEEIDTFAK